jgi:putative aldouronate transport system permease protein
LYALRGDRLTGISATDKGSAISAKTGKRKWHIKSNLDLLLFCLPGILVVFIYHYIPLYGVVIAFKKYTARRGIFGSQWVGMANFERFFRSAYAGTIIWNTIVLSAYSIVTSFPIAMLLALTLNAFRHQKYRRTIQAVTYAPFFISTVVMCGMITLFLSPRVGVINTIIRSLGGDAINFMGKAAYWRHIYVWTGVWQRMGWNSIIYFAALSGVSPDYHEAAIVDGATKFQRVRHIDIPFLIPVATILLILNFGEFFNVAFDKAFALQNDLNKSVSQIISTYVYQLGLIDNDASFSTAVGLFNSAVNAALLITVNWGANKISGNSLF